MNYLQPIPYTILTDFITTELQGTPYIFYTLSGAHLYGFPSCDSDYDIRGCHIVDKRGICGLNAPKELLKE